MRSRLFDHRKQQLIGYFALDQTLPVLGKHRHVPDRIVDVQTHEPAKQQVVVQLLHQLTLRPHRIEYLQKLRTDQLLRRNRRTPAPCVKPLELRVQLPQRLIGHLTDGAQWMILRHPLFKPDVTEYRFLMLIVSAHINYLNHLLVETTSLNWYISAFFPQAVESLPRRFSPERRPLSFPEQTRCHQSPNLAESQAPLESSRHSLVPALPVT